VLSSSIIPSVRNDFESQKKFVIATLVLLPFWRFHKRRLLHRSIVTSGWLSHGADQVSDDSIRIVNKLPPCYMTVVLERAALDQANYSKRFPQAGHLQNGNIKKQTPLKESVSLVANLPRPAR